MTEKPTFVLVPGAWHGPETWDKVSSLLKAEGYNSVSITLPTTSGDNLKSFKDDVKATQDAIQAEVSQDHNVIVVVHSYGGMVGQSAMKGFTRPKDNSGATKGQGYVIGLIVIASGLCQAGMAFLDGTGGAPPPSWRIDPTGFAIIQVPERELFYHDLPEAEGNFWVAQLRKQSMKAFTEDRDFVYPGWQDVPVWMMVTTEDKAFPGEVQKMLLEMTKGQVTPEVREIATSHSPMLSKPEEVVGFFLEAKKAFTK